MSLTVTSDRIEAAGREIANLRLVATGKADIANPAADVEPDRHGRRRCAGRRATLSTAGGRREVKGLSAVARPEPHRRRPRAGRKVPAARHRQLPAARYRRAWRRWRWRRCRATSTARSRFTDEGGTAAGGGERQDQLADARRPGGRPTSPINGDGQRLCRSASRGGQGAGRRR